MALFEQLAVRYMADLQRDFGLLDFQAAGIVGNGGAESGGFEKVQEINPTVKGSAGGLGHFQWTGRTAKNGRRLAFEKLLSANASKGWTARTYEANYAMLFRELKGPESAALAALRHTRTIEEATTVFCQRFERPGILHMDSRIRWAKRALAAYRAKPVPASKPAADAGKVGGTVAGGGAIIATGAAVDAGWSPTEIGLLIAGMIALAVGGYFAWRWWQSRQAPADSVVPVDSVSEIAPPEVHEASADALAASIANKVKGTVACQDAVTAAMSKPKARKAKKPVKRKKRRAA